MGTCAQCHKVFQEENILPIKKVPFCKSCIISNNNLTRVIYPYRKHAKKDEKKPFYFGVEFEMECKKEHRNIIKAQLLDFLEKNKIEKYFCIKDDGSLINGIELVTMPTTLKYISHLKLKDVLNFLLKSNVAADKENSCGLHIHIEKKTISFETIKKIQWFFYNNKKKLISISGRISIDHLDRYSSFPTIEEIQKNSNSNRYRAINIGSPYGTIEFRLFQGTLKYDKVIKRINFLLQLIKFLEKISFKKIQKNSMWKVFLKHINKNKEISTC